MGFKDTLLFMMNMVKKTLQVELNKFLEEILDKTELISKQAYSEARKKIKPEAFIELNNNVINGLYRDVEDLELWNGYRLCAIDGTVLEIPNTEKLRKEFGASKNQSGEVARAKASCIYDVLNEVIIKSNIDGYKTGATKIAIEQDFYASIFLVNMVELTKKYNDANIKEKNKDKNYKYEYKTNFNVLVGSFKDKLIMILLEDDERIREILFNKIIKKIARSTVPIRVGRQNPRNKFLTRSKYQLNKKRCL